MLRLGAWKCDHEGESDFESDGTKELLKHIPDSISEMSLSEFSDIPLRKYIGRMINSSLIFACCPLRENLTLQSDRIAENMALLVYS